MRIQVAWSSVWHSAKYFPYLVWGVFLRRCGSDLAVSLFSQKGKRSLETFCGRHSDLSGRNPRLLQQNLNIYNREDFCYCYMLLNAAKRAHCCLVTSGASEQQLPPWQSFTVLRSLQGSKCIQTNLLVKPVSVCKGKYLDDRAKQGRDSAYMSFEDSSLITCGHFYDHVPERILRRESLALKCFPLSVWQASWCWGHLDFKCGQY